MKRVSRQFASAKLTVGSIVGVALILGGCRSGGPERFELSGKVTYDQQPIPAGLITFEPEGMTINAASIGEAEIQDGQYKTLPGKGVVAGTNSVFIAGYNGIREPGSGPYGASLFTPAYKTSVEIPQEPSTYDFQVPKRSTK